MPRPLRRLALVPDPYPGESLLSWADAVVRLNQVSRPVAARMTGLVSSPLLSDIFAHHISDAVVRSVRHTTGRTWTPAWTPIREPLRGEGSEVCPTVPVAAVRRSPGLPHDMAATTGWKPRASHSGEHDRRNERRLGIP